MTESRPIPAAWSLEIDGGQKIGIVMDAPTADGAPGPSAAELLGDPAVDRFLRSLAQLALLARSPGGSVAG